MTEEKALEMKLPGFVRDTVWVSTAEILGIKNPDSMKYVPVGKKGALIQMRKKPAFNLKSNEWEVLIEIRASLDDYLDGMDAKKIKNLKIDLKKAGKNRADLFEDNADDTEGNWYGLKIGDLNDPSNKMQETGNNQIQNKSLSIRICAGGLSFVCIHQLTNRLTSMSSTE